MPEVYAFDEILSLASSLSPQSAVTLSAVTLSAVTLSEVTLSEVTLSEVNRSRCVTPLFRRVSTASGEAELKPLLDAGGQERFGAGYVRMSTPSQYSDGFSVDNQIKNVIKNFLDKKQAFRIYNDAPMPGFLPYNDPALIARLVEAKMRLYTSVFERVFLSPLRLQTYSPAREASVRQYLA